MRSKAICRSVAASKKSVFAVHSTICSLLTLPFILNLLGLQKYRLHTRRPNSTAVAVQSSGTSVTPPAAPQFVVVGGIWVPPPEYAAAAAAAAAAVAAAAAQPQQVHDLPGDASGTTTTTAS